MISGSIDKMIEQNKPRLKFFKSKNIKVKELEDFFCFREMETGRVFNAVQCDEQSIHVSCFDENNNVVKIHLDHDDAQKLIDSGNWKLMADIETITATEDFFREEAMKLAKENLLLKDQIKKAKGDKG